MSNNKSRGFGLVEVLLVLAVLSVIAFVCISYYQHSSKKSTTGSYSPSSSPTALFDQVKQETAAYPSVSVNTDKWVAQMGSGASIKASGFDFAVSTQSFPSIYFGLNDNYDPDKAQTKFPIMVKNAVQKVMSTAGYKESTQKYDIPDSQKSDQKTASTPNYQAYTKGDSTCIYIEGENQDIASFSCFTPEDVSKSFAQAQPYVASYQSSNKATQAKLLTFGPVTIKSQTKTGVIGASKTKGYDISEAVLTEDGTKKLALFYNKNGGPWAYITQAGDEYGFSCNDYDFNEDVRKAMWDQICSGPDGQIHFGTGTSALQ